MADRIIEAEKSHCLLSKSWRTRGIIQSKSKDLRKFGGFVLV